MKIDVLGGVFRDFIFYGGKHSKDFLEMPGGTGYNVFAGLRVLHVNTCFHGTVGNDWPFEKLNTLRSQKSGVFVSQNEIKVLAVYRGANLLTKYEPLQSKILFATLECGGDTFERYAKSVKKANGIVVLDPSPIFEWKPHYLELCDILLPNADEYQFIFRESKLPKGVEIFEKLGSSGGIHLKDGKKHHLHVSSGGEFSLGCGDAFDVAVLYSILKNKNPSETLKIAVEVGRRASFIRGSSAAVLKAVEELHLH